MMKNKRERFNLFCIFAVLLLLGTAAQATYTSTYLPDGGAIKMGGHDYTANNMDAFVEFAVYDRQLATYQNTWDVGTGRYVYAYQVFTASDNPTMATFELLGYGGSPNPNPAFASGIGSQRDGSGTDIVPTSNPSAGDSTFVWQFADGLFVASTHSAFLVFSSDYAPTRGDVKLTAADNGDDTQIPGTPEPATLAMLLGGAAILLRKKGSKKYE